MKTTGGFRLKLSHRNGIFIYGAANKTNLAEIDMAQRRKLRAFFKKKNRFPDVYVS